MNFYISCFELVLALTKHFLACCLFWVFFRLSFTKGHFPKLAECAHFHYENVDFGSIQVRCSVCRYRSTVTQPTVTSEFSMCFHVACALKGLVLMWERMERWCVSYRDTWLPVKWKAVTDIINIPHKQALNHCSSCSFFLFVHWWSFGLLV